VPQSARTQRGEPTPEELLIRSAAPADAEGVLAIARELVADGTTYVFAPETSDQALLGYFFAAGGWNFVAERGARVLGCYVLRENRGGRGSHVANASYAVAESARGQGVGRALGLHSLEEARRRGFRAMQFNFVVSTNDGAVRLWRSLGFEVVGTSPGAFRHPRLGLVDAYVMHRAL
jgi:GNAT superfamily N-acetyltransferase